MAYPWGAPYQWFIYMLTGHIVAGMAKLAYALMLVFMISIGFYLSLFVFGYELL